MFKLQYFCAITFLLASPVWSAFPPNLSGGVGLADLPSVDPLALLDGSDPRLILSPLSPPSPVASIVGYSDDGTVHSGSVSAVTTQNGEVTQDIHMTSTDENNGLPLFGVGGIVLPWPNRLPPSINLPVGAAQVPTVSGLLGLSEFGGIGLVNHPYGTPIIGHPLTLLPLIFP